LISTSSPIFVGELDLERLRPAFVRAGAISRAAFAPACFDASAHFPVATRPAEAAHAAVAGI
jgi:hypothetical protein